MNRRTALKVLTGAPLLAAGSTSLLGKAVSHRLIGQDKGHVAILSAEGKVEWLWENGTVAHDMHMLPNGNVLGPTSANTIVEITPEKKVVWEWTSKPAAPYDGKIEIHGFQRLDNGLTMIAETGNKRIIEVDRQGKIVHEVKLKVDKPDPHRDTRLVRKTDAGTYLVPHEGDGVVREYDSKSNVIWDYRIELVGPETPTHRGHGYHVFSAYRLPNGNTLIGGGNNNRVLEVNPKREIVWSIGREELPGIKLYWVTQLQALPNGNIIVNNTHTGPEYPQMFEVTRNKEVVWKFDNWDTFGDGLCATQVLDVEGKVIR